MSLLFITVAAGYALGSRLAYSWFGADGTNASFFPAAGVTFAAMVLAGRRNWPVVIAAAATAEIAVNTWHGIDLVPSAGYAVANTVQPLVGALLLRRLVARPDLSRTRDLLAFIGAGVIAAPAVGALLGASTSVLLDGGDAPLRFALEWWVGDGLGILIVGGAILGFVTSTAPRDRGGAREIAALTVLSTVSSVLAFWGGFLAIAYAPLVILLVSGFRLGTRGVALTATPLAFIAAQATADGRGFMGVIDVPPADALLYLQGALGVLIASAYGVAAEVNERERAAMEQEAAQRFRTMADIAPAMLWVTDREGRCTYLSRGWHEFTGRGEHEGLGFGWTTSIHPDDRTSVTIAYERATRDRQPFTVDYRLRRADGEWRRVIDTGRPLHDPDGDWRGCIGSVIDIHDRERAESALRGSEARFRAVFESVDEGYCLAEMILDPEGRPVDYRFLETNRMFEEMTGLSGAAGRTALELVPGLEHRWIERYARVALDGEAMRFEEGSEAMGRWFDVYATPLQPHGRFAVVFKDITGRHRAEMELRERELEQRRARRRAEFLAEVIGGMESAEGVEARAERLLDLLVPRIADRAELTSDDPPAVLARRPAVGPVQPPHSRTWAPLETGTGRDGRLVLSLCDPDRRPYTPADEAFVTGLAARAGALLASARVHEEEHRVALSLQRALLPNRLHDDPAVEIGARYAAASGTMEVGGDWYDTFSLPDGRIGFAVGDVVGHGLESAATMGRLRTALAALAPHTGGPGQLLDHLQQFCDGPNGTAFATACYAVLDPRTGVLEHASAGHPPILAVAPDGATRWLEDGRSMPLCVLGGAPRPEASTRLQPGSLIVLFTDGVVERRGVTLATGMARLEAVVRECRHLPAGEICDRVLLELSGDAVRRDDMVLVAARFAPVPSYAFHGVFPARPEELRRVRTAADAWLRARGVADPYRMRLLLTLGEACSNVVRHAYPLGGDGTFEVDVAEERDGRIRVIVRDSGRWRPPSPGSEEGYGMGVIHGMGDDVSYDIGAHGTTVQIGVTLPGTG